MHRSPASGLFTRRQAIKAVAGSAIAASGLPILAPTGALAAPVSPRETDQADARYFARTGHNLRDPFRTIWRKAGGEKAIGAPISEERYQEGVGVVQTFEA